MDTLPHALDIALHLPLVQAWPELQSLIRRGATANKTSWSLPRLACQAVGGSDEQAAPAVAAIACAQIAIILIDDMLDADPRGEYHRVGEGAAANFAAALQAVACQALAQARLDPPAALAAQDSLNHMLLATALGQHQDSQNPADEAGYWQLVRTKSSPFYAAALHLGALAGGATAEVSGQLERVGQVYGEMIQIHDDLNDTMATPANPDWTQGRSPLPILFAQVVEHPERNRFLELRQAMPDPAALEEAQTILIRCGAVAYCLDQLLHRYDLARQIVAGIPLAQRAGLERLLEELVDPVRELFRAMGVAQPA
jgi:geranylgeranyl pyrophosphate synthase